MFQNSLLSLSTTQEVPLYGLICATDGKFARQVVVMQNERRFHSLVIYAACWSCINRQLSQQSHLLVCNKYTASISGTSTAKRIRYLADDRQLALSYYSAFIILDFCRLRIRFSLGLVIRRDLKTVLLRSSFDLH